MEGTAAVRRR